MNLTQRKFHPPSRSDPSGGQLLHVDDEAIADVRLLHPLIGLVDLIRGDGLDVAGDAVPGAEVQHLLRLPDPADQRAGDAPTTPKQRQGEDGQALGRQAQHDHGAVARQQLNVAGDLVGGRDGVDDQVELLGRRLHRVLVGVDQEVFGPHPLGVGLLAVRGGQDGDLRPHGRRQLDRHMAQAAQADDRHPGARPDAPFLQRQIQTT